MRRTPVIVLTAALMLAAVGFALAWNSEGARTERERQERLAAASGDGATAAGAAPPVLVVDALRLEETAARVVVDIAVTLEAVRTVLVGAEVAGRVVEVPVREFEHVEAGAVLARLDPKLPEAAVAQARASWLRARSTYALATQEHGRQRNLSDKGVSSVADFDRTESEELRSDADVEAARAALSEAETRLEKTRISAPFPGVVSELDLEPGAYLQIGAPVARVSDLSAIEVEAGVDDRQILALSVGQAARLSVDAYPGRSFAGQVTGLPRTPDPVTRKYPVRVELANPDEQLLPGMIGRVRFELGESEDALRIPRRSVYSEFEVHYLFVLDETDAAAGEARVRRRRVAVAPVPFRPDLLDVVSGVEPGERIAASGVRDLRDGLRVRVRELSADWSRL